MSEDEDAENARLTIAYLTTADNCGHNGETVSHFGKPSQYCKNPKSL